MENEELVKKIESIAKTVNLFKSEAIQEKVFKMLMETNLEKKKDILVHKKSENVKKTSRKGKKYNIIGDLNFRPKDDKSLKDFIAEKKPKDNQERFAVIIYYLTNVLKYSSGITVDHIYTAFKEINEKIPSDIVVALSKASGRKGWFETKDMSNISLNVNGENFVEHDLPKSK